MEADTHNNKYPGEPLNHQDMEGERPSAGKYD